MQFEIVTIAKLEITLYLSLSINGNRFENVIQKIDKEWIPAMNPSSQQFAPYTSTPNKFSILPDFTIRQSKINSGSKNYVFAIA